MTGTAKSSIRPEDVLQMSSVRASRRSTWLAVVLLCLVLAPLLRAQTSAVAAVTLTPRSQRLSDEVIARDLQRLDALHRAAQQSGDRRGAAYVGLARDAYERNEKGPLSTLMLGAAAGTARVPRSTRADLWAVLDSARATPLDGDSVRVEVAALEAALVRAQYPLLGAPSCAAWEREAERLSALVRLRRPAPMVAETPLPLRLDPLTPTELRGVPNAVHFALDRTTLSTQSRNVLAALVDSLRYLPTVKIVLEGRADLRTRVQYNVDLMRRRTLSVRSYLELLGIDVTRITIVPQGTSEGTVTRTNPVARARNQRVQLRYFTKEGVELSATQLLDDLQPDKPPQGRRRRP